MTRKFKVNQRQLLRATILPGFIPAIVFPILWPLLISMDTEKFPDIGLYLGTIPTIGLFALILGMVACLIVGLPSLYITNKYGCNNSIVLGSIGAIFAALFLLVSGPGELIENKTGIMMMVVFSVVGFLCGMTASKVSRHNTELNSHYR